MRELGAGARSTSPRSRTRTCTGSGRAHGGAPKGLKVQREVVLSADDSGARDLYRPARLRPPMARAFHVIVERDEDGWCVGTISELPGCHTQAKSLDQLRDRIHEAIRAYVGTA